MNTTDWSFLIGPGLWNNWIKTLDRDGYDYGIIRTPRGHVIVQSEPGYTLFTVAIDGRGYRRQIDKGFSRRYLVTLAKRFVEEL